MIRDQSLVRVSVVLIIASLAGLALLLIQGCGGVLVNLDRTNELTASLTASVRPKLKKRAKEAQDKCFADAKAAKKPKPKSMDECQAHRKIWDFRRTYYDIANSIHVAVKIGAIAYELKDEKGAVNIAIKAAAALLKLKEMVIKAGLLKAIGL